MPDSELLQRLVGLITAVVIALLTVPAFYHAHKTTTRLGRGYVRLGGDEGGYEDRDGIATEDSIRAFSDTRPRVAVWLGVLIGLGASVAARVVNLKGNPYTDVSAELFAWTEPACWVRLASFLPFDNEFSIDLDIGLSVLAMCLSAPEAQISSKVPACRVWHAVISVAYCLGRPSPRP